MRSRMIYVIKAIPVKGFIRTRKGKMERVESHERKGERKSEEIHKRSKEIVNRMSDVMKLFKQKTLYTCGPASIRIALSRFGKSYSEKEIAKIANTTASEGTNSQDLIKAVKSYGINTVEYKNLDPEYALSVLKQYIDGKNPVIISWLKTKWKKEEAKTQKEMQKNIGEYEHYSVISGITDTHIYLFDPLEEKELKVSRKYFMDRWWDSDDKRWFLVLTGEMKG